jgi:hypothetical protein
VGLPLPVVFGHAQENANAGPDVGHRLTVDDDARPRDPLDDPRN